MTSPHQVAEILSECRHSLGGEIVAARVKVGGDGGPHMHGDGVSGGQGFPRGRLAP